MEEASAEEKLPEDGQNRKENGPSPIYYINGIYHEEEHHWSRANIKVTKMDHEYSHTDFTTRDHVSHPDIEDCRTLIWTDRQISDEMDIRADIHDLHRYRQGNLLRLLQERREILVTL